MAVTIKMFLFSTFLCSRHCEGCFMGTISFNSQINSLRQILLQPFIPSGKKQKPKMIKKLAQSHIRRASQGSAGK